MTSSRCAAALVAAVCALGAPAAAAGAPAKPKSSYAKRCSRQARAKSHARRVLCRKLRVQAKRRRPAQQAPAAPVVPRPVVGVPTLPTVPGVATPVAPVVGGPVASTLGVQALDVGTFVLRLTRTAVPAGDLTVYFRNGDISDHNLWLARADGTTAAERISDTVGGGASATRTVPVSAGAYTLYCTLPGHEDMARTLTVG